MATEREPPAAADGVHVDPAGQLVFLEEHTLAPEGGVVAEGTGKLKLVLGSAGAGKTHFLEAALALGQRHGMATVLISAERTPLYGFDHLYQAVAGGLDLAQLARDFVTLVLRQAGYEDLELAPGQTLGRWCQESGREAGPMRVTLEEELHRRLVRCPDLDLAHAQGLARWCELVAWGSPPEDPMAEGLLERWLRGERVARRDCNRLRLRRPVDRYGARLWLRSLVHFLRAAGRPGLVVAVDDLGVVLGRRRAAEAPTEPGASPLPHYTRQRRDDLYEMLRTLVDEMGLLPGLLLLLAAPPEILTDGRVGIPSYVALEERMKSEVQTVELNRFADTITLERLWAADPEAGRTLAERLAAALAPTAGPEVRARAVRAALEQWRVRDVTVGAVRETVLAALGATGGGEGSA